MFSVNNVRTLVDFSYPEKIGVGVSISSDNWSSSDSFLEELNS